MKQLFWGGVLFVFFYLGTLLFTTWAQSWEGKRDNKSVAELELMNDKEITREALDVCSSGAIAARVYNPSSVLPERGFRAKSEAGEYLDTLQRVWRKAHQGNTPSWFNELTRGH
jgi:hypothetical protein